MQALSRQKTAIFIFIACAALYAAFARERLLYTAHNAPFGSHYVHLANSFLHGQLETVGNRQLYIDDEAHYKGHWYISFPPLPALILIPFVALFGLNTPATLIWVLIASLGPALLWSLLEQLNPNRRTNAWLVALFATGTIYFCAAVQGTVWFSAQALSCVLMIAYLLAAFDCRAPLLAGALLGAMFLTRPPMLLSGLVFVGEWLALRKNYSLNKQTALRFVMPLMIVAALSAWMNLVRFDSIFEFGHRHLQVRWAERIQRYGLFHWHYLKQNLYVFLQALPERWPTRPWFKINTNGLALWFTSPALLFALRRQAFSWRVCSLGLSVGLITCMNLLYQNTGWEQFGYRFSLDYVVLLIVLIALKEINMKRLFITLAAWSILINTFGAWTFNRVERYYDHNPFTLMKTNR